VYVDTSGNIKTIANHKIVSNVAVLFDMWEHSFIIDHGADRKKYIKDMWKVINWSIINARLN
jgi:superoxide dismutase